MPQRSKGKTPDAIACSRRPGFNSARAGSVSASKVRTPGRWLTATVCVLLGLAVWLVFSQTLNFEFVNYDSNIYVYENSNIQAGMSLKGIVWAFSHVFVDQWCPLTAISHMMDCEVFGLYAGGHHLTNVLLHTATVILLFLVLRKLTGTFWRSAFVAGIFAIHPLRVESVAWVSERKDVLSGLFFMLTVWAYVSYVRERAGGQGEELKAGKALAGPRSRFLISYCAALLFFTLGLMCKAMLVTMPFLLLLLDWWPLRRTPGLKAEASGAKAFSSDLAFRTSWRALVMEKVPLLLLAAAVSVVTVLTDKGIHSVHALSMPWRVANALVAYATYLKQMFYPVGLAVFYPHPESHLPFGVVGMSAFVLLTITVIAAVWWRKRPYLLMGWLWYLGMLVPVIGLLQVGSQAHADRYTYLPQIGLYLSLTWAAVELLKAWRYRRMLLSVSAVMILVGLGVRAHDQAKNWRNNVALWEQTLACTSGNYVAYLNLGCTLADQDKLGEAIECYKRAIEIKPSYAEAYYNWGVALGSQGKMREAIPNYEQAIRCRPDYADAHNNLANALVTEGKLEAAVSHYKRAIQLKADFPEAWYNLGNVFSKLGNSKEAILRYERALQLRPDYAEAHYNLGNRLAAQGRLEEAIRHFERVVQIKPDYPEAYNNLGNKLAALRKWDRAIQHYERALQLRPDYAEVHNNLGVTLSGQGKLDEAVQQYRQATRLKPDYAEALANLGGALSLQGKQNEAMEHLHEALRIATAQTNRALAEAILKRLESSQFPSPQVNGP